MRYWPILLLCLFWGHAQSEAPLFIQKELDAQKWVDSLYTQMTIDEKNWSAFYGDGL